MEEQCEKNDKLNINVGLFLIIDNTFIYPDCLQ